MVSTRETEPSDVISDSTQPVHEVVVEVRGGAVVAVYSDSPRDSAVILDWDNIEDGDSVGTLPVDPIEAMPAPTRTAIRQARTRSDPA